ncbi:MAG: Ig-like domain repeat protein [Caldilineaceae bacterium]|nr:Ig-like domain repeat protein [Caldilineaceae bacterium]
MQSPGVDKASLASGRYNAYFWHKLLLILIGTLIVTGSVWWLGENGKAQHAQVAPISTLLTTLQKERPNVHISKPQVSPDGQYIAITIVPLGTETASLATTLLYETATHQLRHTLPGYAPLWLTKKNDGTPLLQLERFQRAAVTYVIGETIRTASQAETVAQTPFGTGVVHTASAEAILAAELNYPTTIRVAHHPSNGCRDVADWQIDLIPFEEYVARVVPAEVPVSWPLDALAAQAVAARTYAWRQILAQRTDYDVTDWANFQMMCDARYTGSDAAVTMTAGQYLVSTAEFAEQQVPLPISAMYSAENGHPTLTNANVTYLQSVPDLFALGRARWGHGYGLSQWGAYRRARAGQNYRQILGHYYTHVYLANGIDNNLPIGALLDDEPGEQRRSDAVTLRAMLAPTLTPRFVITASQGLTAPIVIAENDVSWRPPRPLAQGTALTATLWLEDQVQDQRRWQIDYAPPTVTVDPEAEPQTAFVLPTVITQPITTLSFPMTDDFPLLTNNSTWEGEALHHTLNSGTVVSDVTAHNGLAWQAEPTVHEAGVWYGPYTSALVPGHSYQALFWLRTTALTATAVLPDDVSGTVQQALPVARLDVTDNEGLTLLGLRDLQRSDFRVDDQYAPIAVEFYLFDDPQGLEFRVAWAGQVPLALDRIEVWQRPDTISTDQSGGSATFQWDLRGQPVIAPLQIRYADRAGNLGAVYRHHFTLVDTTPPSIGTISLWAQGQTCACKQRQGSVGETIAGAAGQSSNDARFTTSAPDTGSALIVPSAERITLTATISDSFTGLASERTQVTLTDGNLHWVLPISTTVDTYPWHASVITSVIPPLETLLTLSERFTATVTIYDQVGNRADRARALLIDTVAPTITVDTHESQPEGWYLEPLTVTVRAVDTGSGPATLTYTLTQQIVEEQLAGGGFVRNHTQMGNADRGMRNGTGLTHQVVDWGIVAGDTALVAVQAAGHYTLTVQAVDQAGNRSAIQTLALAVDLAAPTVLLAQHTVDQATVQLAWQSHDDSSGIAHVEGQLRSSEQAWTNFLETSTPTGGVNVPIAPAQSTAVRVRVQDHVGRWSEWTEIDLWIATDWVYLPLIHRAGGGE